MAPAHRSSELLLDLLCKWCDAVRQGRRDDAIYFADEIRVGVRLCTFRPEIAEALAVRGVSARISPDALPDLLADFFLCCADVTCTPAQHESPPDRFR